jgi:hypothetical protein
VGAAERLPDWHDRSPFRSFISLWADDNRLALLHGATVARSGEAVVLAGVSGSGKSTTALACLDAGLDFLGDDACLVDPGERRVYSLYGRAKLEPSSRQTFGPLGHVADEHVDTRGAQVLEPRRVAAVANLQAVLLIEVGDRPGTALSEPLSPDVGAVALAVTLREENAGLRPEAVAALEAVAASVPVRRLVVGADRAEMVARIRAMLG